MAVSNSENRKWSLRPLALLLVPFVFRIIAALLFGCCRVREEGGEHFRALARGGKPFIVTFWHYGVIYIVHRARNLPYAAMVSASSDGEFVARILESKGFSTVRGSRNRGAVAALKGIMREMKKGRVAVLVADGSQGPARKVQAGTILLAARTGAPILPVGWAASRVATFRSWDRTALPLPFSRVLVRYGEPLHVPPDQDVAKLEESRLRLEAELDAIYVRTWEKFGKEKHW